MKFGYFNRLIVYLPLGNELAAPVREDQFKDTAVSCSILLNKAHRKLFHNLDWNACLCM